jgi:hypothetical protein
MNLCLILNSKIIKNKFELIAHHLIIKLSNHLINQFTSPLAHSPNLAILFLHHQKAYLF